MSVRVEHLAGGDASPVVRSAVARRGIGRTGLVVGDVQNMVIVRRCIEPGAFPVPAQIHRVPSLIAFAYARGR
jgi:hypothetical protein